jgi:flavin reductase (DIM6/NTAB) family NADH-FMN oxidoreductase RutF
MDPDAKKKALRQITYGLYVMTSESGDRVAAGTVNWLSQASFNPPLIMAAVKADSSLNAAVKESKSFAVNVLSGAQKQVAEDFFRPAKLEGGTVGGHAFTRGSTGAPILDACHSFFECRVTGEVAQGDHTVYVAEVVDAGYRQDDTPLVLRDTGWSYGG